MEREHKLSESDAAKEVVAILGLADTDLEDLQLDPESVQRLLMKRLIVVTRRHLTCDFARTIKYSEKWSNPAMGRIIVLDSQDGNISFALDANDWESRDRAYDMDDISVTWINKKAKTFGLIYFINTDNEDERFMAYEDDGLEDAEVDFWEHGGATEYSGASSMPMTNLQIAKVVVGLENARVNLDLTEKCVKLIKSGPRGEETQEVLPTGPLGVIINLPKGLKIAV